MIEQLVDQLSPRDRAILLDLARVRVLTGEQLTRLHFQDLSITTRDRTRRRVLARLAEHDLVTPLERTIGGARAGSAGLVFALGVTGQRALPLLASARDAAGGGESRARRPWTPGQMFLKHSLAISELYVQLHEAQAASQLVLGRFAVEAAAWWPDGAGGLLKPDASACVAHDDIEDSWFVEVDRATESPVTLGRKLRRYVDFARTGQLGPDGVTPRVLLTVPHERRMRDVRNLMARLPPPADQLIFPEFFETATARVVQMLRE
ncbi:replication-relaxation family protein [Parafrankia sp. BMG5.11]|uniref:replication-relaxation family protein n=1 Tax=Parafrankia sp. BMG5.11 TaxID=222540 RepID=UPI001404AA15|nr:replication-relaxation family protein [Parafrankia sp. BMG5.11]